MLEVEMKFRADDLAAIETRLTSWNAKKHLPRTDVDHYFNAPDRDFAKTDEAVRVRQIGEANYVTYKGPKRDMSTKTRTEIEVSLAEGAETAREFQQLLIALKYRPVTVVKKARRIFSLDRKGFSLEVSLDQVEGVGQYVELEIRAPEEELDSARHVLMETADELGLTDSERRSYLELLLLKKNN
jgi:adenylate cyclase class 2